MPPISQSRCRDGRSGASGGYGRTASCCAAGDFKSATEYRLYPGDEDAPVDPLIAAAEGIGRTPALRGLAYAVFENFQLADYGNRIPSLTFEVEADAGPVTIGAIAEALSDGAIAGGATPAVQGYAASGDSVRAAVEALTDVVPVSFVDDGTTLGMSVPSGEAATVVAKSLLARPEVARRAAGSVADEASIAYYDVARDYQSGLQRAVATGSPGRNADRRALPAALSAETAKALAEYRLATLRAGRGSARLRSLWRRAALRPGTLVRIEGEAGTWKIRRWTLGATDIALELEGQDGTSAPASAPADSGVSVGAPDLVRGPTTLRAYDPPMAEGVATAPQLIAFAAGISAGWRYADLIASFDGGANWQDAGRATGAATMGRAIEALGPGPATLLDTESTLEVALLNDEMWLENASDDALVGGANLALVGRELIQFGRAESLGDGRFRLSRLLRGRYGTEWAAALHIADEDFVLFEADRAVAIAVPAGAIGGTARISAIGIGDGDEPATVDIAITGEALRPPAPVHLAAERLGNGDIRLSWVRRSRAGWSWPSGSDTPLGEEAESYRVDISGDGFARSLTVAQGACLYTAAEQVADGASGPILFAVTQIGTYAPSRAATLSFT